MIRLFVSVVGLLAPTLTLAQQSSGSLLAQTVGGRYVVYFPLGKSTLNADALTIIEAAAQDFQRTGSVRISVRGYTDTSGNAAFNQVLSERREQAVANELIRQGVPAAFITGEALGETQLAVPTGDGVQEAENRRVDINVEQPPPAPEPVPAPAPAPAPVAAAPEPEPEAERDRGLFSLGAFYGFNLEDENDNTSHLGGLNLSFDYALTPWLGLGLEQAGFYHFGTENDGFGGRSAAGLDFILGRETVIPYVGANLGYLYGSGIDDDFFAGPEVGIVLGWFNAKVAYDVPFNRDVDEGIIATTVGLGIRF